MEEYERKRTEEERRKQERLNQEVIFLLDNVQ